MIKVYSQIKILNETNRIIISKRAEFQQKFKLKNMGSSMDISSTNEMSERMRALALSRLYKFARSLFSIPYLAIQVYILLYTSSSDSIYIIIATLGNVSFLGVNIKGICALILVALEGYLEVRKILIELRAKMKLDEIYGEKQVAESQEFTQ